MADNTPLDYRFQSTQIGEFALRLPLRARPPIPSPLFDIFKPDDVERPVGRFQPSAREIEDDAIAMIHGSVQRVAVKNSTDAYFSLSGEFDIFNKSQLSAALEESVRYRTVTIDLAHTTFIDASILGVFVRLANRCEQNNGAQVRIVNASAHIRRLFSICQLEGIFDIEDHRSRITASRAAAWVLSHPAHAIAGSTAFQGGAPRDNK